MGECANEYIMSAFFANNVEFADQTETYYYMNHDHLFKLSLLDSIMFIVHINMQAFMCVSFNRMYNMH